MRASCFASLSAAVCLFSGSVGAEDLASAYLRGSTSITGGVSLYGYARGTSFDCGVGAGATVRRMSSAWAFEGRLGVNASYGENPNEGRSSRTSEAFTLGGAFGRGFALGDRVVMTPMLSFGVGGWHSATSAGDAWTTLTVQAAVEVPLTVMLSRSVYYEPYLSVSAAWQPDEEPVTNAWFGQRFGVVF